jgi:hypothetical protein
MPQTISLSLDWGPGEKGKTEKQAPLSRRKMTFHSSTLMLRSGAWTGGLGTHQSIGGGTPTFHLEMGALRPPVVTFAERAGFQLGVGLSPGLPPFWAFSVEVPFLPTMAANLGCRP